MINSKYQINIDDSVFEQLHQYRQINGSETGGILLGYILPHIIYLHLYLSEY